METYSATYGAVIGDICGSIYEWQNRKTDKPEEIELINHHCYFTDDTVLTVAVMDALKTDRDYRAALRRWANKYPLAGYGSRFKNWMTAEEPKPYNSYGNGFAMRVSPVAWYPYHKEYSNWNLDAHSIHKFIMIEAKRSAECTHNHKEGIKGATAVATAMFFVSADYGKEHMKDIIEENFGYNLS
jgi:ADP-ribosylglycohydrolase